MNSKVAEASSEVIAAFMQQVIVQYYSFGGHFRRVEPRESVAIPIRFCPLDESFEPQGDEFGAVTRDVSCSGIGFFHTRTIEAPFVKITIAAPETGHQMNLLARVEHCTPCGDFHVVGCRLVGAADGDFNGNGNGNGDGDGDGDGDGNGDGNGDGDGEEKSSSSMKRLR